MYKIEVDKKVKIRRKSILLDWNEVATQPEGDGVWQFWEKTQIFTPPRIPRQSSYELRSIHGEVVG